MVSVLAASSLLIGALVQVHCQVSSKVDFDSKSDTSVVVNSTQASEDDVELKHTIVISTKFKNSNHRGIYAINDGDSIASSLGRPNKSVKEDSGEVPVYKSFKAIETTQIHTPDSRFRPRKYPDSVVVSRNIGDELDVYPNLGGANQWRPSTFYNNINLWSPEDRMVTRNIVRKTDRAPGYGGPGKNHRKITDDGITEFYCCKCRELTRRSRETHNAHPLMDNTTPKIKIDGKLAKLK